jgi:hypothetical protein
MACATKSSDDEEKLSTLESSVCSKTKSSIDAESMTANICDPTPSHITMSMSTNSTIDQTATTETANSENTVDFGYCTLID